MKRLSIVALLLPAVACQTSWDRYDQSLYVTIMEPSEEAYAAHISTLEFFVAQPEPPPGMCAELAYYLVLAGRPEEARQWLDKEVATWPESSVVVEALRVLLLEEPRVDPEAEMEEVQS